MVDPDMQHIGQNGPSLLFEFIPAVLSIAIGVVVGTAVFFKTGYLVLGIFSGILAVPLSFLIVAYGFMLLVLIPLFFIPYLFNKISPDQEYFDDP
ncbi:MAG: hypothetical protein JKY43_04385 [Phycisphaerales bacterium]|nr:hypothetical protein [Phycisphaerales bacterium]